MSTIETRERILDMAERLFAERGYAATSMRAITQDAGVNLAAVNYHFGTKENLLCEVVRRRVAPINADRLRRLDALEGAAGDRAVALEDVLRGFIEPVFALCHDDDSCAHPFLRLIGRLYAEPVEGLTELFEAEFGVVFVRYGAALAKALPGLPPGEVFWGVQFVVGMLTHVLMSGERVSVCTEALCDIRDAEGIIKRMIAFAAAGFRTAGESND